MATVHFDLKNLRQADQAILEAIRLDPNDWCNWYELARMCHLQHDASNALKWATRALELAPAESDVMNLYAVCGGRVATSDNAIKAVLALDPEHALAHTNLGIDHLDSGNLLEAEGCFRRALAIDPTLKIAKENLLLTIKRRDLVYRILCAPIDGLSWIVRKTLGEEGRRRNVGVVVIGAIFWLLVARFVIALAILWMAFGWPMLRFYEVMVIGDLRKKAGEIGATRGGWLGYRRWPSGLRLAIFGAGLVGFWAGVYSLILSPEASPQVRVMTVGALGLAVLTFGLVRGTRSISERILGRLRSWRRERLLRQINILPR
jgi:hypothetical protein